MFGVTTQGLVALCRVTLALKGMNHCMSGRTHGLRMLFPLSALLMAGAIATGSHGAVDLRATPRLPLVLSYAQVIHRLGPWLAARSAVAVDLPSVSLINGIGGIGQKLAVGYQILQGGGYRVVFVLPGMATTANQVFHLPIGGAGYVGSIWALPATAPWPTEALPIARALALPAHATVLTSSTVTVLRPHDGTVRCFVAPMYGSQPMCQVLWHQDHWRLTEGLATEQGGRTWDAILQHMKVLDLDQARRLARTLAHRRLPGTGLGWFNVPATTATNGAWITYQSGSTRYIIEAWNQAAGHWAEAMTPVR